MAINGHGLLKWANCFRLILHLKTVFPLAHMLVTASDGCTQARREIESPMIQVDTFRQYHTDFVTVSIGVFAFKYKQNHSNAHPNAQVASVSVIFTSVNFTSDRKCVFM